MASEHYDVLVIDGGTAGLVAAKRAAGGRRKVAIVERDRLGGECLWTGCIPAKTLLNSASIYRTIQKAQDYGLPADNEPLNWPDVVRAKDEVVARIAREDGEKALASADAAFLRGSAAFLSQHEVLVFGQIALAQA
ncbi:MAG: FAD-dependent oxidoreductase [Chloroflexi bacterium]|nr:FAD-dependent oxidoreductase [Chloroflexota bacterium]MCL5110445.1 FAD-dependent oxidoreductase [Chloroflexota bacterium]